MAVNAEHGERVARLPEGISNAVRPAPLRTLELGRFIAAFCVALAHFVSGVVPEWSRETPVSLLGGIGTPGALAVQYFFVLSGFVMMTAHGEDIGKPGAAIRFWVRRAGRIYPVYWLAVGLVCIYLSGFMVGRRAFVVASLWPVEASADDLVPTAWTLRYEIAFYLMFGLCLLPKIGRFVLGAWIFVVLWANAGAFVGHTAPSIRPSHFWTDGRLFVSPFNLYFFAGLLAARLFATVRLRRRTLWTLLAVGIAGVVALLPVTDHGNGYGPPGIVLLSSISIGAFILSLAGLEQQGELKLGRWAVWLGALSYPFYMLHLPLQLVMHFEIKPVLFGVAGLYGLTAVSMAGFMGLSALVAVGFDRPLQRLLRSRTQLQSPRRPQHNNLCE